MANAARPLLGLLVAAAVAAPAGAAPAPAVPDELSPDRLDRAALVALPAVWRLEVEVRVEGLRTGDGRRVAVPEAARAVGRLGTAFAVSPAGYLVSAAHVVAPSAADLAATAYLQKLAVEGRPHGDRSAREWVKRTAARPVGLRIVSRTVRQATVGPDARRAPTRVPQVVAVDWKRDLVLLRIRSRDAPALPLTDGRRPGTRVAVLGFGQEDAFSAPQRPDLVPAVRKGRLGETRPVRDDERRVLTRVSSEVERGDSGGPAVDGEGRVRGVVIARDREGGGFVAPTADVARLLDSAGVRAWEGRTSTLFRRALGRLERFDLEGARAGLQRTLGSYPAHGVARYELERLSALRDADLRLAGPPRLRGGLLALAALAALGALACGVALARPRPRPGGGSTGAGRRPA